MRISKPRRGRKANRRLDMTEIRSLVADQRTWCAVAIVTAPDDGSKWWRIVNNREGAPADIVVDVITQPDLIPLTCRLGGFSGRHGVLEVPAVGDEVIVGVPAGQIDFMPTILGHVSNSIGAMGGQGAAEARTVIVNAQVLVHDGEGGAVSLALKSDVQQVRDELTAHTHLFGELTCTGGTVAGSVAPGPSVTAPVGTSILLGK